MKSILLPLFLICCLGITSCKENQELLDRIDAQKVELSALDQEIQTLNSRLRDASNDHSEKLTEPAELTELNQKIEAAEVKINSLLESMQQLEVEKKELEQNYRKYAQEFPIPSNSSK